MLGIIGQTEQLRATSARLIQEGRGLLARHDRPLPQLDQSRPIRFALFGQYNTGKSTLVNALVGRAVATTGDAPETKVAHEYPLQGFEIQDLPGGDARIEESEEALSALRGADVVLYVTSSQSGFDYATTWLDLQMLMDRKIPFLLVVNDKIPHMTQQDEEAAKASILGHFYDKAAEKLGNQQPPVVLWVRARAAEKGRVENKDPLVDASGICHLEAALQNLFTNSGPLMREMTDLRSCADAIRALRAEIQREICDSELAKIEAALNRCDDARRKLAGRAATIADSCFGSLASALESRIYAGFENQEPSATIQADCNAQITSAWETAALGLANDCEAMHGELSARITVDVATYTRPATTGAAPAAGVPAYSPSAAPAGGILDILKAVGPWNSTIAALFGQGAKGVATAGVAEGAKAVAQAGAKEGAKAAAKEGAKAVAKKGTEAGIKATAEGAAKGTLAGFAKRAAGPVTVVGFAVWDLYNGWKTDKANRARLAAARRCASEGAQQSVRQLRQNFAGVSSMMIQSLVGTFEAPLSAERVTAEEDGHLAAKKLGEIAELLTEIDAHLEAQSALG